MIFIRNHAELVICGNRRGHILANGVKRATILAMDHLKTKEHENQPLGPADDVTSEVDHAAWKDAKVKAAVKQASDRSVMVPASDVWEHFGFER